VDGVLTVVITGLSAADAERWSDHTNLGVEIGDEAISVRLSDGTGGDETGDDGKTGDDGNIGTDASDDTPAGES
jgi:hypothetical protein